VLDMHSGIPGDINNGSVTTDGPYPGYRDFLLRTLGREFPERPVNTAWAYSNSSYVLMQNLVEHVTHESFYAYTREHLFAPMGMSSTTFDDVSVPGAALSREYAAVAGADGAVQVLEQPREYVNVGTAGSVVSSATDMAAYLKTMIAGGAAPGGRILAASTVQEMITPQTDLPLDIAPFRAGLGWFVGDEPNAWMGKAIYWNGDTANFHTFMRWLPALGLGVYVSVNTSSPVSLRDQVGLQALGLMVTAKTGRTAPPPPSPAPVVRVPAGTLRRAAGLYATTGSGLDIVTATRRGLRVTVTPAPPGITSLTVLPRADGWYVAAHPSPANPLSSLWVKPATVTGRHLLLQRSFSPPGFAGVSAVAEKIPPTYRIPNAWRARTASYRATSIIPGTYPGWVPAEGTLMIDHGVLIWNTSDGAKILVPAGSQHAFTFGFQTLAVQRDDGDVLTAAGNTLTILGTTYRRAGT